ncbi:MAG TPA: SDR family NAD(P)-dependent oxidoreductase [Micrococcaceae bacterium]|nr:SDR family NAD(P)-dependent oxidoreductase [Micrococcaceae bacterium]
MRLSGAGALVTGASSGIGRAIAVALADAGCRVLLTGRDEPRLAQVAAQTGGKTLAGDLCEPADLSRIIEAAMSFPVPDLVVHCAGIGRLARIAEPGGPSGDDGADAGGPDDGGIGEGGTGNGPDDGRRSRGGGTVGTSGGGDDDGARRLLETNYLAPVRLTRALLPAMLRRGSGRLVFVGSIAGVLGVAGESEYAASKAALGTFAASLGAELSGTGVGVTTLLPGVVETDFFDRRGTGYQRRFPRPLPAERVAGAVLRAVERDRAQVVVPGWLRVPIALQACAPEAYARLAARWG